MTRDFHIGRRRLPVAGLAGAAATMVPMAMAGAAAPAVLAPRPPMSWNSLATTATEARATAAILQARLPFGYVSTGDVQWYGSGARRGADILPADLPVRVGVADLRSGRALDSATGGRALDPATDCLAQSLPPHGCGLYHLRA